jgi:hypothetical protein
MALPDTGISNVAGADRPQESLVSHTDSIVSYGKTHQQVNLAKFGQFGWATAPENWAVNTHDVSRQMEVQVLQTPGAFKAVPGGEKLIASWVALFETHCKTIEGFELGYDYEYEETAFGGTGQMYHDLTNIKRKQVNPKTTYVDYYGRPIFHFLNTYMQLVGMNAETKYPDLVTLLDEASRPTDYLNDQRAGIVLFWEPTPDHRRVENAVLVVNMMPKTTGSINMRRDMTANGELTNIDVDWTGTAIFGSGIQSLAQTIMTSRSMLNSSPSLRPAHLRGIGSDIMANSSGSNSDLLKKMSQDGTAVLAGKL